MFAILNGADLTPAREIVSAHSALGAHQEKKSFMIVHCLCEHL